MLKTISRYLVLLSVLVLAGCGGKKGMISNSETPELILEKGKQAYQEGQYAKTMEYCQFLLDNYPTSDLHIDTQLLMAKTLGAQEKFEEQMDLLLRVLKENIIPERVPLIYMQIGEYYEHAARWNPGNISSDTLDLEQAIKYYHKAVVYKDSDDRSVKAAALYRVGLLHAKIREMEMAVNAYQQLVQSYPESPYSILARTKLLDPANTEELPLPTVTLTTPDQKSAPETPVQTAGDRQMQELISTPSTSDTVQVKSQIDDQERPVFSDSTLKK